MFPQGTGRWASPLSTPRRGGPPGGRTPYGSRAGRSMRRFFMPLRCVQDLGDVSGALDFPALLSKPRRNQSIARARSEPGGTGRGGAEPSRAAQRFATFRGRGESAVSSVHGLGPSETSFPKQSGLLEQSRVRQPLKAGKAKQAFYSSAGWLVEALVAGGEPCAVAVARPGTVPGPAAFPVAAGTQPRQSQAGSPTAARAGDRFGSETQYSELTSALGAIARAGALPNLPQDRALRLRGTGRSVGGTQWIPRGEGWNRGRRKHRRVCRGVSSCFREHECTIPKQFCSLFCICKEINLGLKDQSLCTEWSKQYKGNTQHWYATIRVFSQCLLKANETSPSQN